MSYFQDVHSDSQFLAFTDTNTWDKGYLIEYKGHGTQNKRKGMRDNVKGKETRFDLFEPL